MVENLAVEAAPGRVVAVLAAIAAAVLAMIALPREAAAPGPSLCPMIRAGASVPHTAIQTRYRGLNPRYLQRELHRR